jgi:catechol 2,3-dioxygenase-like lactoylglutathione lyase family enzyme
VTRRPQRGSWPASSAWRSTHRCPVTLANGVGLDYDQAGDTIEPHHYAFLADDDEFDAAFGRISQAGLEYYADPGCREVGQINHRWGGRGVYFRDPDGHLMEILTRPAR